MVSMWDSVPIPPDVLEIPVIVQQVLVTTLSFSYYSAQACCNRADRCCVPLGVEPHTHQSYATPCCGVETAIRSLNVNHTGEA